MKTYMKHLMPIVALAMAFAACDDTNESGFVPAEPVPADNMAVYFDNTNPEEFIILAGEEYAPTIDVSRLNCEKDSVVPINIISLNSALSVPAQVEFEAGQETAQFELKFDNLEPNKKYEFDLQIDEAYTNPYKATPGAVRYTGFVSKTSWDPYKKVTYSINYKGDKWQNYDAVVYRLGEMNRYRIEKFLGTDCDFTFYLGGKSSYDGYSMFEPYNGYEDYLDSEINSFYWYDAKTGDYPVMTMDDGTQLSYICVCRSWGSTSYSYISNDFSYGQLYCYEVAYEDGSAEWWKYMTFYFSDLNAE